MQMPDMQESSLRVGIVARSSRHRKTLTKILDDNGLNVVDEEILQAHFPDRINLNVADVLLVNLDDTDEPSIDALIEETNLPILFNDGASIRKPTTVSGKAWGRRLAGKLADLVQSRPAIAEPPGEYANEVEQPAPEVVEESIVDEAPDLHLVEIEAETEIEFSIDEELLDQAVSNSTAEDDEINDIEEIPVDIEAQSGGIDLDFENLGLELHDANESESPGVEEITYDSGMNFDLGATEEPEHKDDQSYSFAEDLDDALSDLSLVEIGSDSDGQSESDSLLLDTSEALEIVSHEESEPAIKQEQIKAGTGKLERETEQVWVLGASIGGPEAVKRFLAALPKDMPVAFVLAQHIGSGFVTLLAEQLGRVSRLEMLGGEEGTLLQDNQLLVAPVEKRLTFDDDGKVALKAVNSHSIYSPSIDDVMMEVAKRYGGNTNAIVFSGMGNDGTAGCQIIAGHGGQIWAQTADTCVISSMSDSARNTGNVTYSASPEDLAANLIKHLGLN